MAFNKFEFIVFVLLDPSPNQVSRTQSALLFAYSWRENNSIHIFPKVINTKWNANCLFKMWTRDAVSISSNKTIHHGICIYIYIYIYICVCVCVCKNVVIYVYIYQPMGIASSVRSGDQGSVPGWVIPKTEKKSTKCLLS